MPCIVLIVPRTRRRRRTGIEPARPSCSASPVLKTEGTTRNPHASTGRPTYSGLPTVRRGPAHLIGSRFRQTSERALAPVTDSGGGREGNGHRICSRVRLKCRSDHRCGTGRVGGVGRIQADPTDRRRCSGGRLRTAARRWTRSRLHRPGGLRRTRSRCPVLPPEHRALPTTPPAGTHWAVADRPERDRPESAELARPPGSAEDRAPSNPATEEPGCSARSYLAIAALALRPSAVTALWGDRQPPVPDGRLPSSKLVEDDGSAAAVRPPKVRSRRPTERTRPRTEPCGVCKESSGGPAPS